MVSRHHDIGSQITVKRAAANTSVTAGSSTTDNVEVNGVYIDRLSNEVFLSGKVAISVSSSLGAGNTISVTSNVQHSSVSSSGWADYAYAQQGSTTVAYSETFGSTSSTAGQSISDVAEYDVDLGAAKRYIRVQFTPNMSASSAETATLAAMMVLGGGDFRPPQ